MRQLWMRLSRRRRYKLALEAIACFNGKHGLPSPEARIARDTLGWK
jgi:hypothetical protein